jgi:hypothetical protein
MKPEELSSRMLSRMQGCGLKQRDRCPDKFPVTLWPSDYEDVHTFGQVEVAFAWRPPSITGAATGAEDERLGRWDVAPRPRVPALR